MREVLDSSEVDDEVGHRGGWNLKPVMFPCFFCVSGDEILVAFL